MHNVVLNDEILNKVSVVSYDKLVSVASVSEITMKKSDDDDILKILEEEGF